MIVGASVGGALSLMLAIALSVIALRRAAKACGRCREQRAERQTARKSTVAAVSATSAAVRSSSVHIAVSELTLAAKSAALKAQLELTSGDAIPQVAREAAAVLNVEA